MRADPDDALRLDGLPDTPTSYEMCRQAWELDVDVDGQWFEVLAWGVFSDAVVRHFGADPASHVA